MNKANQILRYQATNVAPKALIQTQQHKIPAVEGLSKPIHGSPDPRTENKCDHD